jgi:O-antigen ligase
MSLFIGILISRPKFILFFFSFIIASISAVYFSGLFKFSSLMERGFSYRFDIWSQSLEIFMEKPLLGYGLGGDRPEIVLDIFSVQHSHNIFLSNMLDAGLLGLFLLLSLFGLLFYWSLEYFKKTKNATFFCMVLFSFLANLVDGKSLLVSPDYQWIGFWLPVGLCAFCELSLKHDKAANVCESA